MMGAFFSMFSPGSEYVALAVNLMSVFSSSFTILFLFWSITMLFKKLPSFKKLDNFYKKNLKSMKITQKLTKSIEIYTKNMKTNDILKKISENL